MRTAELIRTIAINGAAVAALASAPAVLAGDPPQYAFCGACHAVGVAGAPATGNAGHGLPA